MTLYSSFFKLGKPKRLPAVPEDPLGTARFLSALEVIRVLVKSFSLDADSQKLLEVELPCIIQSAIKAAYSAEDVNNMIAEVLKALGDLDPYDD